MDYTQNTLAVCVRGKAVYSNLTTTHTLGSYYLNKFNKYSI